MAWLVAGAVAKADLTSGHVTGTGWWQEGAAGRGPSPFLIAAQRAGPYTGVELVLPPGARNAVVTGRQGLTGENVTWLVRDLVWVMVKRCFQIAPISAAKSPDDTQPGLNIRAVRVLAQRAACGLRQSWQV